MDKKFLQFQREGHLSGFDLRMAALLCELSGSRDSSFFMAAALLSQATTTGDVCLSLVRLAGRPWPQEMRTADAYVCPSLEKWCETIAANPSVGRPGERRPLILDSFARLYFYRYWEHERNLCDAIRMRVSQPVEGIDGARLKDGLRRLFPGLASGHTDWQAVACISAVLHRFAVVCGGPGTGKTRTVAGILSLLLDQPAPRPLRISLSAPTGKAAARLSASIQAAKSKIPCDETVRAAMPEQATTLHRLLKAIPGSSTYRHDRRNPLAFDVVVVDEASLVDIALMSHLVQALSPAARLILVGDRDQLASVEAGSVLGDICDKHRSLGFSIEFGDRVASLAGSRPEESREGGPDSGEAGRLADSIVVLRRSYRFDDSGGIGRLARQVNAGDARGAFASLQDPKDPQVRWQEIEAGAAPHTLLAKHAVRGYRDYLSTRHPLQAMKRFERFKILCVVKAGPFGVDSLNGVARRVLADARLLTPQQSGGSPWYAGRPVLITRNDYDLGLFNGDMGIALPDPESETERLLVFFPGTSDSTRRFEPQRLSDHETVFAMTVHKSQGSEFDHVLLVLPERDTPVLTRELIYTAVTRARRSVTLLGRKTILEAALSRTIQRTSGLRDGLWGPDSHIEEGAE